MGLTGHLHMCQAYLAHLANAMRARDRLLLVLGIRIRIVDDLVPPHRSYVSW